jgi:hypothetical protein
MEIKVFEITVLYNMDCSNDVLKSQMYEFLCVTASLLHQWDFKFHKLS